MDVLRKQQFYFQQTLKSVYDLKNRGRSIRPIHKSRKGLLSKIHIYSVKSHDPSRDPEQDLVFMMLHQSEGLLFHHHYQVRFQVNVRITLTLGQNGWCPK